MPRRPKPPAEAPACAPEMRDAEPCPSAASPASPPTPAEFRESAQAHVREALEALVELTRNASSEHVRVAAANAILDRALGKPLPGAKAADDLASEADGQAGVLEVRWLDDEEP